jgi:hypothetical protein
VDAIKGNVMAKRRLTEAELAQNLFDAANRLFDGRVELRRDYDRLADAYGDASGFTSHLYADPEVKATRDAVHRLDGDIGEVARSMERLARRLKTKHASTR